MTQGARRNALAILIALLVAGLTPLAAQQQPEAEFEEQVTVSEVLLDVLVEGPRGDIIVGLDEEDFIVREDGEPVDLESVTFYSNRRFLESRPRAEELGIDPGDVPSDRYFLLFFHNFHRTLPRLTTQQLDAGRWARKWARSSLLPNDHVMVVSYDYTLKIHQDFTTDDETVVEAISAAVQGQDPTVEKGGEVGDTARIYQAMEVTARDVGQIPARKNMILFSIGFGRLNEVGLYTPDVRYYPDMVRTLNDNNVAVYAIDLIPTSAFGPLRTRMLGNALSNLAADTGGRYYFNFANFGTPLEQISEDTSGYYLLSYDSTHPAGASGFQEVEVSTVNPQFTVRAREGYHYGGAP